MAKSRIYEIAYLGLKMGIHEYEYALDDSFLQSKGYEDSDLSDVFIKVKVTFDKHESFFQIKFDFDGSITVPCDRCADPLQLTIWEEYNLIIKLTNNENELNDESEDDDVVFMPRTETIIDLSEYMYEFLLLSIPIQKVHGEDEEGISLCNPEAIKMLEQFERNVEQHRASSIWDKINTDKK